MAIDYYLKKAEKTPQTGSDETRNIVADMLAKIEAGGEEWRLPMAVILTAMLVMQLSVTR